MAETKFSKSALATYKTMCDYLTENDWKFDKQDDVLVVHFTVKGDDFPMDFLIAIDSERDLVRLLSFLPFAFPEDKREAGAIVTSYANYMLADGNFDYDYTSGRIAFRLTTSFKDSLLSKDVFDYLISIAEFTVDEYNDKFFMVGKGALSVEDFLSEDAD